MKKKEYSEVPQNSTINVSPKYSNTGHLMRTLQHSWIAVSEHADLLLCTYVKYITAVILIAFLQVEEDQEANEVDYDKLLVGDEDSAD